MFLQAFNAVVGAFGTLFAFVLGINLGGITLGVILGGMVLVTVLFKAFMKILNIEMSSNYKDMAKQLKQPGKFEIKK